MPTITYIIKGKPQVVEAAEGESLFTIAQAKGVPMEGACGGNGFCTTCKCKIRKGGEHLGERTGQEENLGVTDPTERLGCQAIVQGDVEVEVLEN
ncbi:MAG: 2Fe-2S iron-sulfur cluster-binding protein [Candidatus Peregrinibacteria bacterium]